MFRFSLCTTRLLTQNLVDGLKQITSYTRVFCRIQNTIVVLCIMVFDTHASNINVTKNIEGDSAPYEEQVVVTGTRSSRLLAQSPVPIDVIDKQTIQAITRSTLEQVLNVLPGVDVTRSVKDGFNIQLQGFQGDDVAVLVDGLPIISPTGSATDFAQLSALNVDRIEVLRGASSVLYGSNAFGGVVNIITDQMPKDQFRFIYDTGYFTENKNNQLTDQKNIIAGKKRNNWGVNLTLQKINEPAFTRKKTHQIRQREADLEQVHQTFSVSYNHENVIGHYQYSVLDEEKRRLEALFPGGGSLFYTSDVNLKTHTGSLQYQQSQFKARSSSHYETSGNSGNLRTAHIEQNNMDIQTVFNRPFIETVLGAHFYSQSLDQIKQDKTKEITDESIKGIEAFIQSDLNINDDWSIVGGVRLQEDKGFGFHHAKKLSLRFNQDVAFNNHIHTVTWRSNIGEAYNIPTLKERFFYFDHSNLGYIILGNKNLQPEKGYSFGSHLELVTDWRSNKLSYHVNAHYAKKNDAIETILDPVRTQEQGLLVSQYENIPGIEIYGADVGIGLHSENTDFNIEYNFLSAKNINSNTRLPDRPKHKIKSNIVQRMPSLNSELFLYLNYKNNEQAPDGFELIRNHTFEMSATLSYRPTKKITTKIGVENIFNEIESHALSLSHQVDIRSPVGRYLFLSFALSLY